MFGEQPGSHSLKRVGQVGCHEGDDGGKLGEHVSVTWIPYFLGDEKLSVAG